MASALWPVLTGFSTCWREAMPPPGRWPALAFEFRAIFVSSDCPLGRLAFRLRFRRIGRSGLAPDRADVTATASRKTWEHWTAALLISTANGVQSCGISARLHRRHHLAQPLEPSFQIERC